VRFLRLRRLHFVGAGGVGMSGLAEILLLSTPLEISGCDRERGENTDRLTALGAKIAYEHDEAHVEQADLVVISAAIAESSPEVQAARRKGIPVIRRAEMLAEIMRLKQGIGVAGTHGKTTTTSLTGMVLTEAGFDPTIVVGGRVRILGTNARLGKGDFLVAEADEYDRSFLELTPVVAVVTNIEADHLDTYRDLPDILEAFTTFANRVPFYGAVVACLDDPGVRQILPRVKRRVVTYGESPEASLRAGEIRLEASGTTFDVWEGTTWSLGTVRLPLPGRHNVCLLYTLTLPTTPYV
jgi:UDP-N-acetylmuramate--alanine ligase